MAFVNRPRNTDFNGDSKIKRYVHSPLAIEHNGIQANIHENGRVTITKVAKTDGNEVEFDEVEVPASFIFKVGSALKLTRHIEYVSISEVKEGDQVNVEE